MHMQEMKELLESWSELFHKGGSRNSADYYISAQKAFPNVRAIAEMSAIDFKTCFSLFVEAVNKYQELVNNGNPATD